MNNKGNLTDERPPFLPMLIGTGFYSGLWPWGPGTAGSILATLIWLLLGLWLRSSARGRRLACSLIGARIPHEWLSTRWWVYGSRSLSCSRRNGLGRWQPLCSSASSTSSSLWASRSSTARRGLSGLWEMTS